MNTYCTMSHRLTLRISQALWENSHLCAEELGVSTCKVVQSLEHRDPLHMHDTNPPCTCKVVQRLEHRDPHIRCNAVDVLTQLPSEELPETDRNPHPLIQTLTLTLALILAYEHGSAELAV